MYTHNFHKILIKLYKPYGIYFYVQKCLSVTARSLRSLILANTLYFIMDKGGKNTHTTKLTL